MRLLLFWNFFILIDIIHQVYIFIFSALIATIMGILLDVETIFKIVKIPIPVFIGK